MVLYNLSLLVLSAHDTDCLKIPHAFTHRLEKCCPFRTVCRCVGCIFYIAAGVDCLIFAKRAAPTLKPEYGAYEKPSCARAVSISFSIVFYPYIIPRLFIVYENSVHSLNELHHTACPKPVSAKLKKSFCII